MIINITILEDNESDFITLSDSIKKWAANTGILINIIWLNSYKKFIKSLPTLKCDLFFSDIELNCNNSFTGIDDFLLHLRNMYLMVMMFKHSTIF